MPFKPVTGKRPVVTYGNTDHISYLKGSTLEGSMYLLLINWYMVQETGSLCISVCSEYPHTDNRTPIILNNALINLTKNTSNSCPT
jgi:hypothetical protein